MSGIFLSYRRSDAAYIAGRLRDDLAERFGSDRLVFRDVESMPIGPFPDTLTEAVAASDVVLVVIGDGWLSATGADGRRRLDDPEDWVRREVAAALAHGKVVVPVLVETARLPRPSELPDDLAALPLQQAVELPDSRWDYELGRLADQLGGVLGVPADQRVFTGPWASPDAPVVVTVTRVEARPERIRFHLAVENRTAEEIELAPDWFDVADDADHAYEPVPPWDGWAGTVPAGARAEGFLDVAGPLQPAAKQLVVGWMRALGTFEVGAVHATVELRSPARPGPHVSSAAAGGPQHRKGW